MDVFGDPNARPNFFSQFDASSFIPDPDGTSPDPYGHGYDVVSTLAGKFDFAPPTGADPFADCVIVHQFELGGRETVDGIRHTLAAVGAEPAPRVILTSSVVFQDDGFCGANADQSCDAQSLGETDLAVLQGVIAYRAAVAGEWARLLNSAPLADKLLMTQSAGNVDALPDGFMPRNYLGFRSAMLSSPAGLATHIANLQALLTDSSLWSSATMPTLPDLTFSSVLANTLIQSSSSLAPGSSASPANLLVVDSGTKVDAPDQMRQSDFDFLGADVRAVGQDVVLDNGTVSGTSFATPEVAGLAAYLWNLSPALEAQPASVTASLIRQVSTLTSNSPTVPVVDAYAAVLRLDNLAGCCASHPGGEVRFGLLDVDGDGGFTGLDLQKFAAAYDLANPNAPSIPAARDFGRFDLNGDGYTGGIITAPFDLDPVAGGPPAIGTVTESIEGYTINFNEAALSDIQILCYYAYSPLYASDNGGQNDQLRTSLLGPDHCVGARLNVQLPAQISGAASLDVTVEVPSSTPGQYVPGENLVVDFSPTCATVNPTSGRTNANGAISTTVTPNTGCALATVGVVARADVGTTPLASTTASTSAVSLPLLSTFATGLDGWTATPPDVLPCFNHASWDSSGYVALDGADDRPDCIKSEDMPDGQPNSSISKVVSLPVDATSLEFDVAGHDRASPDHVADGDLRIRFVDIDNGGMSTTVLDWTTITGAAFVETDPPPITFSHRVLDISAFAGKTVRVFFEQGDNGPGENEQVYLDNIYFH